MSANEMQALLEGSVFLEIKLPGGTHLPMKLS
jgi:hypothetical protein